MTGHLVQLQRDLDFAPLVVWDALVDADLVSGWLAEAEVEPRIGGRYDLTWHAPVGLGSTPGEVADLVEGELLVVELERLGRATFSLVGESHTPLTRLSLSLDTPVEPRLGAGLRATLVLALAQLDELLRGRPVDWDRWEELYGLDWAVEREREAHRVR